MAALHMENAVSLDSDRRRLAAMTPPADYNPPPKFGLRRPWFILDKDQGRPVVEMIYEYARVSFNRETGMFTLITPGAGDSQP